MGGGVRPDLDAYERDGFWTSWVLFDEVEVARFVAAGERVVAGEHRTGRAPTLASRSIPGPGTSARSTTRHRRRAPRSGAGPALAGPALWKSPGGPATTTIGWHQDWVRWSNVADAPDFVTAWVALDDVDDQNGAMQMLPGSHRWGVLDVGNCAMRVARDEAGLWQHYNLDLFRARGDVGRPYAGEDLCPLVG